MRVVVQGLLITRDRLVGSLLDIQPECAENHIRDILLHLAAGKDNILIPGWDIK